MKRRVTKGAIFALASLAMTLFSVWLAGPLAAAPPPKSQQEIERQIKEEERKLKKLENQIAAAKRKQRVAAETEKKVIRDINTLSSEMSRMERRLTISILKRNQVLNRLSDTVSEIATTSTRINGAKQLLRERMVAMYKYGGIAEFNLFMSAGGARDALETSYLLSKIAEQDKALISDLFAHRDSLDKARENLVKQKIELERRNRELEGQKVSIQRTARERNRLLGKVRKDKALFQAEQEELLRASRELQQKVTSLLAAKKRMQEQNRSGATPLYYKGGRLAWPLRGKITSSYGSRIHPVFKTRMNHTGIDIEGKKGDPVRAAADGEVLYTGWLRGYGQVIVLDHGGNLTTVYAHLSGIETTENAKVKAGDRIGLVGSTGTATGNHLHFEVRVNGNTTDPMRYLQ